MGTNWTCFCLVLLFSQTSGHFAKLKLHAEQETEKTEFDALLTSENLVSVALKSLEGALELFQTV